MNMRMTAQTREKWIVRLLEAGLIAATIAAVAGCSTSTPASSATPTARSGYASQPDWEANRPLDVRASTLNIFGEFDGEHRGSSKQLGEAGFQQHTYLDEGYDTDVVVDPTGQYMVFASTRNNEHPDIYMQRVDGLSVTQLTNDPADDAFPAFSADGKQIAFASTRSGVWQIYTMDADGRNVMQVTNGLMQAVHPSFSPDGRKLVYAALGGRSAQWEIWTVDLLTGEKRMISYGLFPSWSPDKSVSRIAFQRPRQRGSRWFSLWTLDLVDGEARRVTEVAASTNAAVISPCWSPDGKRLAFSTVVDPARDSDGGREQQDIWTINTDGSGRKRVTDGNGTNLTPFWANDGRIYFISDRGGQECVWSAKTRGGTLQTAAADKKEVPAMKPKDPFANEASAATDLQDATH
jgi:Tol biopolymer transport system component